MPLCVIYLPVIESTLRWPWYLVTLWFGFCLILPFLLNLLHLHLPSASLRDMHIISQFTIMWLWVSKWKHLLWLLKGRTVLVYGISTNKNIFCRYLEFFQQFQKFAFFSCLFLLTDRKDSLKNALFVWFSVKLFKVKLSYRTVFKPQTCRQL